MAELVVISSTAGVGIERVTSLNPLKTEYFQLKPDTAYSIRYGYGNLRHGEDLIAIYGVDGNVVTVNGELLMIGAIISDFPHVFLQVF